MLITVIGGGATGLMAATVAAWNGAKVRIIERKGKLAKKLLASSNGRGNFSNLDTNETHYYSNNLPFVKKVLDIFGVVQTLSVFEELGIMVKEKGTKLFPYTEKSKDIVTNFIYELEKHNVEVVLNFQVDQIIKDNEKFLIKGQHRVFQSDKV
ncbi:MAG: HI0933 family protein, partial [Petrotoga mobilis]